jgi:hypothetical protein
MWFPVAEWCLPEQLKPTITFETYLAVASIYFLWLHNKKNLSLFNHMGSVLCCSCTMIPQSMYLWSNKDARYDLLFCMLRHRSQCCQHWRPCHMSMWAFDGSAEPFYTSQYRSVGTIPRGAGLFCDNSNVNVIFRRFGGALLFVPISLCWNHTSRCSLVLRQFIWPHPKS